MLKKEIFKKRDFGRESNGLDMVMSKIKDGSINEDVKEIDIGENVEKKFGIEIR